MTRAWMVLGLLAVASLGACDKNCQNTCEKIYGQDECNILPGGQTSNALIRDCVSNCRAALAQTGPMGDYDPNTPRDPQDPKDITNEKQAAAWMDCVAERECPDLDPTVGYCEPI